MAQRTVGEARAVLDQMVLAPEVRKQWEKRLAEEEGKIRAETHKRHAEQHATLDAEIARVAEGLSEVASELRALEREARGDEISAEEYRRKFEELNRRRRDLMFKTASLKGGVDQLEREEEDPIGATDELYRKYPSLPRPNFDW
jgi:chromosome segregation ATPase